MAAQKIAGVLALCLGLGGIALAQTPFGESEDAPGNPETQAAEELNAADMPPAATEACFNVRSVRNFDAMSDEHVFIEGRRNENFLLTMQMRCFGLRNSFGIAIANEFNRVCSNDSAHIYYRDIGRLEACRIRTVEQVDSRETAEQIIEMRRAGRRKN